MSEVMRQLHQDHRNVARLLDLLDKEVAAMGDARRADFELMQDIMQYMSHYPDRYHHPTEDLVFQRVLRYEQSARDDIEDLLAEHQRLAEKGAQLLAALNTVVDGALVQREPLEAQAREYIDLLRGHMRREESTAFAAAKRHLRDEDWAAIQEATGAMQDPLFGEVVDEDYRTLYQLITQSGE